MDEGAARNQVKHMIDFIANEAQDKSRDIQKKGEEEFSIEVHRLLTEQKEKIRQTYEKKTKKIETDYAIAKSMAINKQRLEKIKARQEVMQGIAVEVKKRLVQSSHQTEFTTKLIVQGLLMLLEKEVTVRCRKEDVKTVQSCLLMAESQYSKIIQEETGQVLSVTLALDTEHLPPAPTGGEGASCLGGVMLLCQRGKITIDNTIDSRLALVMEQAKPNIRALLFPQK